MPRNLHRLWRGWRWIAELGIFLVTVIEFMDQLRPILTEAELLEHIVENEAQDALLRMQIEQIEAMLKEYDIEDLVEVRKWICPDVGGPTFCGGQDTVRFTLTTPEQTVIRHVETCSPDHIDIHIEDHTSRNVSGYAAKKNDSARRGSLYALGKDEYAHITLFSWKRDVMASSIWKLRQQLSGLRFSALQLREEICNLQENLNVCLSQLHAQQSASLSPSRLALRSSMIAVGASSQMSKL